MRARQALIGGAGLGAVIMFFFDPSRGRRRRAMLGDRMTHLARRASYAADVTSRDIAHRTRGIAAEMSACTRDDEVTDRVLVGSIRCMKETIGDVEQPGVTPVATLAGNRSVARYVRAS